MKYPSFWQSKHLLAYLLLPFSYCFQFICFLRRKYYQLKKNKKFPIPIIIVGNITVGGTGKTPLVIWLANLLKENGYKPAIISRGYKSKAEHYPQIVTNNSDPQMVGDEALLLARNSGCKVFIDPDRNRAVKKILKEGDCNIVISDDGLQHYALQRDIEIAVIDGDRLFGNNFCLPAGPLREPVTRLSEVDFVVCNSSTASNQWSMHLLPKKFVQVIDHDNKVSAEFFVGKKIHAVAAIGNPQRFFAGLQRLGLEFTAHSFPDHYEFQAKDFDFGNNTVVLMTEKDMVKCEAFADQRYWYLPVVAQLPEEFALRILDRLKRKNNVRL